MDNSKLVYFWLKKRLVYLNIPSLTLIDDVVNYITFEYGQYINIYDYDRLVQVSNTVLPEFIENTIGVFYNKKATSTIGYSIISPFSVTKDSVNIVVEYFLFNFSTVFNNLQYYEKQDYFLSKIVIYLNVFCQNAIKKIDFLIRRLAGGLLRNIFTTRKKIYLIKKFIILMVENVSKILGLKVGTSLISHFFSIHNFTFVSTYSVFYINVPSSRLDIIDEIDLIGVFVRFYGINKIVAVNAACISNYQYSFLDINLLSVSNFLKFREYNEVITYSFIDAYNNTLFLPKGVDFLEVSNPISMDMSVLRVSLLPGLLKVMQYNKNRQCSRLRLFEVGTKFYFKQEDYFLKQVKVVSGLCAGSFFTERWCSTKHLVDFFDIKNDVENLCIHKYGNVSIDFKHDNYVFLDSRQSATVYINKKKVGFLGLLCSYLLQKLKIKYPVFCFEIDLEAFISKPSTVYKPFSKQPCVRRDLAIIVKKEVSVGLILSFLKSNISDFLIDVIVFDVYYNYSVLEKSISFGLFLQHNTQTLTEDIIKYNVDFVLSLLHTKFDGVLRRI